MQEQNSFGPTSVLIVNFLNKETKKYNQKKNNQVHNQ